ncbi:MAG: hypothetical protein LBD46_02060 [Endomicrobium sp.]|nr:hypothetical protein [Endomicrobium sp.]
MKVIVKVKSLLYYIYMEKIRFYYYEIFKVKAAFVLALFLVSVMVLDTANLTLIMKNDGASRDGRAVTEVKNELGRICDAVNMPVKIVNKMFEKKGFGDKIFFSVSQDFITVKILYASISAVVFTKYFAVFVSINKKQFLNLLPYSFQGIFLNIQNVFWQFSDNEYRLLLLFLIIMSVLPRGDPLIKKNKIKI